MHRSSTSIFVVAIAAILAVGCDDDAKPTATTASAKPTAAPTPTPASSATEPPKPKGMPELTVDPEGPYMNGQRADLAQPGGLEKLQKIIKELPINGNPVDLLVDKKAKIAHVATAVTELGRGGAPKVTIKTNGRDDLPHEIVVTPETRVSNPPGCSIATMVLKDLSTAIWPIKGGTGKRQRKGLAGPDLSQTGDELKKELAGCDSTMAFFSADDGIGWESAFNLAGTLVRNDEKKKIDTLVLLHEAPVAGRPVTLAK